MNFCPKNW